MILKSKNNMVLLLIILSAVFVLALAASLLLPLIFESNIVSYSMVLPEYSYDEPFGTLTQNQSKKWFDTGNPLQAAQYDGEIHNPTSYDIISWYIEFDIPEYAYISDSWNGTYTRDGNTITMEPPKDYNRTISPGGNITYGFIMYAPKSFSSTDVTFHYKQKIEIARSWYFYVIVMIAIITGISLVPGSRRSRK